LESVTIPASVTSIDRDAFSDSDKVIIRGTTGSYAEYFANAIGIPFNAPIVSIDEPSLYRYQYDYILYINQSCTLNATQKPADLAQKLKWSSSDSSIISIESTENGMAIKKALAKEKIYVATLWPNALNTGFDTETDLAENILPLPCDQRYSQEDMQRVIDTLLKIINIH
jgi:hypothetical protein